MKAVIRVRNKLSFNFLPDGNDLTSRISGISILRCSGCTAAGYTAFCMHSSVTVTENFYTRTGRKNAMEKAERLSKVVPVHKIKVSRRLSKTDHSIRA